MRDSKTSHARYRFLGPHRDRCLVTVVFSLGPQHAPDGTATDHSKRLWVRAPTQLTLKAADSWAAADPELGPDRVAILVGQELEDLSAGLIPAAEHCVACSPGGDVGGAGDAARPRSAAGAGVTRLSAALVLSSPLTESFLAGDTCPVPCRQRAPVHG